MSCNQHPATIWGRQALWAGANTAHATLHKKYLKSGMDFLGLRKPVINELAREILRRYPLPHKDAPAAAATLMHMALPLWNSSCFEERSLAIGLLGRGQRHLLYSDFETHLRHWPDQVENWAHLDELATKVLGVMALRDARIFIESAKWTDAPWMWTRRASLLLYIPRIRKQDAFPQGLQERCEALVLDKDFFIRKAMGWVLRELSQRDAETMRAIFLHIGNRASGLTVREALRKLPPDEQRQLRDAVQEQ